MTHPKPDETRVTLSIIVGLLLLLLLLLLLMWWKFY